MHDVEAWLLANRPPRYVQLATAAAPEGERSINYWKRLGEQAAERLGVEPVFVDVRDAADAANPALVNLVRGAGAIYFSGGNPSFLARTLAGSPLLAAITAEWQAGASLAGCSAGAMAIGGYVPNLRHPKSGGTAGFGIVSDVHVLPHFDRYSSWIPNFAAHLLVGDGYHVVGIDEDTALIADPQLNHEWQFRVAGRQRAWLLSPQGPQPIDQLTLRVGAP
jgi:cyanophycinase-like exopeptidase